MVVLDKNIGIGRKTLKSKMWHFLFPIIAGGFQLRRRWMGLKGSRNVDMSQIA